MEKKQLEHLARTESEYLIGTKAMHKMWDVSRPEWDLFYVTWETETHRIWNWVTWFWLVNVEFPKETSRKLTKKEKDKYNKCYVQVASHPPHKLNIK
jgi:hypothetical protein